MKLHVPAPGLMAFKPLCPSWALPLTSVCHSQVTSQPPTDLLRTATFVLFLLCLECPRSHLLVPQNTASASPTDPAGATPPSPPLYSWIQRDVWAEFVFKQAAGEGLIPGEGECTHTPTHSRSHTRGQDHVLAAT